MFKTVITVTVLSDTPIDDLDLASVAHEIDNGDCVGTVDFGSKQPLTREQMAAELVKAGSSPDFFGELDDETNE